MDMRTKAQELVEARKNVTSGTAFLDVVMRYGSDIPAIAQAYLDKCAEFEEAVQVLGKIAKAEIPPHGSPDSWAINMARDFLGKVSE